MSARNRYAGGCHCGNLRYVFSSDRAPQDWPVRRCTCSYCVRLGARYTSGPDTRLEVTALGAGAIARYEFGTRTAEFFRCQNCGVMVFAGCQIGGAMFAVLNVNTLDDLDRLDLDVVDMDFDGEQTGDRMARRKRNWIADVSIEFIHS